MMTKLSSRAFTKKMHPLVLGGFAAVLSGCAALGGGTPEEIVAKRAQSYWDARIQGDTAKAYKFTNLAYQQVVSEQQFGQLYRGTFAVGAAVKNVSCEPQKCDVGVNLDANPPLMGKKMGTIAMYSKQIWLLEDGQWRLFMEP